ncbi:MAG: Holliday junction resolvase RuvX [bacterium]
MPNILGLDIGDRHTGVAISEEGSNLASIYKTINHDSTTSLVSRVKEIVTKEDVTIIVVGLSLNMKGEKTPQTASIREKVDFIENETGCQIKWQDERLSSKQAKDILKLEGVNRTDHELAAKIILQNYLDRR